MYFLYCVLDFHKAVPLARLYNGLYIFWEREHVWRQGRPKVIYIYI